METTAEREVFNSFCSVLISNAIVQDASSLPTEQLGIPACNTLFTLLKRQLVWCRGMPTALHVGRALQEIDRMLLQGTGERMTSDYTQLVSSAMQRYVARDGSRRHMKYATFATGVSYFLRFLGKINKFVDEHEASNSNSVSAGSSPGLSDDREQSEETEDNPNRNPNELQETQRQEQQQQQPPARDPNVPVPTIPPLPMCFSHIRCLLYPHILLEQSIHIAASMLDSAAAVDQTKQRLEEHDVIGILHRDYIGTTLRYDFVSVTPFLFVNVLATTCYGNSSACAEILDRAIGILLYLLPSQLYIETIPSILSAVVLQVASCQCFGTVLTADALPETAQAVLVQLEPLLVAYNSRLH